MELIEIISCNKISERTWECSVHAINKNELIKFCEGTFNSKHSCLDRCWSIARNRIIDGRAFKFIVNE